MATTLPAIAPAHAATSVATAALDALYRGLFDHPTGESHLARLAEILGADALMLLCRPGQRRTLPLASWAQGDAASACRKLAGVSQLWTRRGREADPFVPLAIDDWNAMALSLAPNSLNPIALVLVRPASAGAFPPETVALLRVLAPDLEKAAALRLRISQAIAGARMYGAMLDHVPAALAIVSGAGEILVANSRARQLINASSALAVIRRRLQPISTANATRLAEALNAATAAPPRRRSPAAITIAGGGRDLILHVLPVTTTIKRRLPADTEMPLALLCFDDRPAAPLAIPASAPDLGVTAAEQRVMAALIAGHRPHSIAVTLGVSIATVRTHLRSLYDKTGHRSLAALTAWCLGSASAQPGREPR